MSRDPGCTAHITQVKTTGRVVSTQQPTELHVDQSRWLHRQIHNYMYVDISYMQCVIYVNKNIVFLYTI